MRKSVLFVGMFVTLFSFTTLGVVTAQYGGAQAEKEKQKPAAKAHTMTGCLEKGTEPDTFRLTNVEGTGPKTVELHAEADKKLAAHVGHTIAITGPAIDPKTIQKGTTGRTDPAAAEEKKTAAEHHMRVDSIKMISEKCS
jgi:hypothetical protein